MDVDAESSHESERQTSPQFIPAPTTFGRQRQFPRRYHDFLPNSTTQVPHLPERIIACAPSPLPAELSSQSPVQSEVPEPKPQSITTELDKPLIARNV
jgi:hypothetical protein